MGVVNTKHTYTPTFSSVTSPSLMAESPVTEQDQLLIINSLLPQEVGLFRQRVLYTCLHVEDSILAVGSENGSVWLLDTSAKKIIRDISVSDSRLVPLNAI